MWREQIEEPLRLRSFLEGDVEIATLPSKKSDEIATAGFDDAALEDLPSRIPHREGTGCLVNVESEILCSRHNGARSFLARTRRLLQCRSEEWAFNMG